MAYPVTSSRKRGEVAKVATKPNVVALSSFEDSKNIAPEVVHDSPLGGTIILRDIKKRTMFLKDAEMGAPFGQPGSFENKHVVSPMENNQMQESELKQFECDFGRKLVLNHHKVPHNLSNGLNSSSFQVSNMPELPFSYSVSSRDRMMNQRALQDMKEIQKRVCLEETMMAPQLLHNLTPMATSASLFGRRNLFTLSHFQDQGADVRALRKKLAQDIDNLIMKVGEGRNGAQPPPCHLHYSQQPYCIPRRDHYFNGKQSGVHMRRIGEKGCKKDALGEFTSTAKAFNELIAEGVVDVERNAFVSQMFY